MSGRRVRTARSMAVMPGAVANPSLRVAMMLEPMEVSHHRVRSRLVRFLRVGRPLGVRPGVWVGIASRSCWRITTDSTEPSTPTAHPAAGLSENAVFTASQTVSSSFATSACHQCSASAHSDACAACRRPCSAARKEGASKAARDLAALRSARAKRPTPCRWNACASACAQGTPSGEAQARRAGEPSGRTAGARWSSAGEAPSTGQ